MEEIIRKDRLFQ